MKNARTILSRGDGLALVKSFQESGLKQKDFCASNNIAYHILQYWKQIYSKHKSADEARFLPISITSPNKTAGIKIIINAELIITVERDSDLNLLSNVIKVCKSCG